MESRHTLPACTIQRNPHLLEYVDPFERQQPVRWNVDGLADHAAGP